MLLVLVLAVFGVIIVRQNTAAVETRILSVTVAMPRAVLLWSSLLVGFVLGILVSLRAST